MSFAIKHLLHINAPIEKVYQAITTINGLQNWWTVETTGNAAVEGIIQFSFGVITGLHMKVIDLRPCDYIKWECVASPHNWVGTQIEFILDTHDGKTRVQFNHTGWKEQDSFYAACNYSWGRYMESLRQLIQTGIGEAYGSAGYRK